MSIKKRKVIKHKPTYKQMALETAVRNPERYKTILESIFTYDKVILNDENLLTIVSSLYRSEIVKSDQINLSSLNQEQLENKVKEVNSTRRADGGFPKGYASRFWTYVRTLSEFGFVYARYNEPLQFSEISKLLVEKKIDDQIAFATQSAIFNRRSPYRNVSNDYNFFKFIMEVLLKRSEQNKGLSYEQFTLSLFSENGDVDYFLNEIESNSFNDAESVYVYVQEHYAATNKIKTVTRDYPDVVLRVLTLTGFISIRYKSRIQIIVNTDKIDLIKKIFSYQHTFTEEQKNNPKLYFEQYVKYSNELIPITTEWELEPDESLHKKLELVIKDYKLTYDKVLNLISKLEDKREQMFKYVSTPLKLEFYLSLLLYMKYGDTHTVVPKYKADSLGMPISHAPAYQGDIYVYSDEINWLVEVTMIRNKQQQLNHETSTVVRHMEEDKRQGYLSFVAPYIHPDTQNFYDNQVLGFILQDRHINLKTYNINEFVDDVSAGTNFLTMQKHTQSVIDKIRSKIA